jgi:phosphatidylcholine synthase
MEKELSICSEKRIVNVKRQEVTAWSVHAYTMLGGVIGMVALAAIAAGETRTAWLLLLVAFMIDMTDGMLARKCRVREVVPQFDGAKIDDLIDFLTYVWAPVLILYTEQLVTNPLWLGLPIIGSLYAYGQPGMKEIDGEAYFVGFPSYWNVLTLYMYWLRPPEIVVIVVLAVFMILSFIPTRYLYPSKNPKFPLLSIGLAIVWLAMIIVLLTQEQPDLFLVNLSLIYPVYYMLASFYVEMRYRDNALEQSAEPG